MWSYCETWSYGVKHKAWPPTPSKKIWDAHILPYTTIALLRPPLELSTLPHLFRTLYLGGNVHMGIDCIWGSKLIGAKGHVPLVLLSSTKYLQQRWTGWHVWLPPQGHISSSFSTLGASAEDSLSQFHRDTQIRFLIDKRLPSRVSAPQSVPQLKILQVRERGLNVPHYWLRALRVALSFCSGFYEIMRRCWA